MRTAGTPPVDAIAHAYVRLALAVGRHDEAYLDYYFGPPEWKADAARGRPRPLPDLLAEAADLLARTGRLPASRRRAFLRGQILAVQTYLRRRAGESLPLPEQVALLYGADVALARLPRGRLAGTRRTLQRLLPGRGPLSARMEAHRRRFTVPPDRIGRAIDACIEVLRRRVAERLRLPPGESFRWEAVRGRPWDAYSYYRGNYRSVIALNLDVPRTLNRLVEVLCHEVYPGHHTFVSLLDWRLVRGRRWREFTVCPLFSPLALVNEGMAKSAGRMILSPAERVALCRDVLAPAAGLRTADFGGDFPALLRCQERRDEASTEASRLYLEGRLSAVEAAAFLMRQGSTRLQSRSTILFARRFGAYALTYVMGAQLIDRAAGTGPRRAARYFRLFGRPLTPAGLFRRG